MEYDWEMSDTLMTGWSLAPYDLVVEIRDKIASYLSDELKLELSQDKQNAKAHIYWGTKDNSSDSTSRSTNQKNRRLH